MYFDGSFSYEGRGSWRAPGVSLRRTGKVRRSDEFRCRPLHQQYYEGLLAGLRAAAGLGIKQLVVRGDSQLVVNQVNKEYDCPQMAAYVDEVRKLERRFKGLQLEHVPRG